MHLKFAKQWKDSFQQRAPLIRWLFASLLLSAFVFFLNQLHLSQVFPIKTVRIYGINHLDQQQVEQLLRPLLRKGFFGIHVEEMRDRLFQLAWVGELVVRREWPDKVEINIIEKTPIALWNKPRCAATEKQCQAVKQRLLSYNGELFTPDVNQSLSLPVFVGPEGQQILMLSYFKDMNRLLKPLRAKISYLELTPYLTWKLILNNGMTLQIGHKDILTRLQHFVKVYPKIIANRTDQIDYIDLRYPNGMAVRWKA